MAKIESIPVLYVRGSNNYDIGYTIGKTFKFWIKEYLETSNDVERYRNFYDTEHGRAIVNTYMQNGSRSHPNIMSEISGLANGVGASFEDMFLLQIASELDFCHLRQISKPKDDDDVIPKGCTDVLVNLKDYRIMGHNDDWTEDVAARVYIVHVTIENQNGGVKEQFVSYCYPGYLPGFCFGMNESLVVTLNTVCPREANEYGTPLLICLRSLLGCSTVEECVSTMKNEPYGCSYGMNINVGSINSSDMCSMEVSPYKGKTQVIVKKASQEFSLENVCYYYHTNIYKFSEVDESTNGTGSRLREKRIAEMTSPKCVYDVRVILGDTVDEKEPIYIEPHPNHVEPHVKTSATAIFDISQRKLHVYKSNPKSSTPVLCLPFF
ncbi:hypothetical protein ACF0H5_023041 [Mactra antiquata]